ncbi:hypothetical protein AB4Y95_18300 [Arthrobacter sp. M-10]|jgi:ABC-type dipeptide/oligopeptide/nickel transport system permease subunit|uniref:hypothetical protein n=1 Tax=unclassified Arthrobacter TaxID=235627 RepID=UPI002FC93F5A
MNIEALAATGKYSNATLEAYTRFQKGMLIRTGLLLGEMIIIMITLASLRPDVSSPFFWVPIGVMWLSVLTYAVLWVPGYWRIVRSSAADRKRRKQGLPPEPLEPVVVVNPSNNRAGATG